MNIFSIHNYKRYCDKLRKQHIIIQQLHERIGYPPYWKRENSFDSLCKTILEQQVSLASAKAVYKRLHAYCGDITLEILFNLSDEIFRAHGVTRQKTRYLKLLAEKLLQEPNFFESLQLLSNDEAKQKLISLKGVGHWTSNVYLLVALNRIDIYPDFDVALINSIAYEHFNAEKISNDIAKNFIAQFSPLQSIASCYFYHAYIQRKKIDFVP